MRLNLLFMIFILSFGVSAEQCNLNFNEASLIKTIGKQPVSKKIIKEDGVTKKQFSFRKELTNEEMLSEGSESKYEPQFYITIYQPSCPERVKIWFYEDNNNTANLSNKVFAGRAFKYLSGVEEPIFLNKLNKLSDVKSFESYDDKADSKFLKVGDIYSIDVYLR